jgi:hypothetical protein
MPKIFMQRDRKPFEGGLVSLVGFFLSKSYPNFGNNGRRKVLG